MVSSLAGRREMPGIPEGLEKALTLILTLDGEVYSVVFRSLKLSLSATVIASLLGIPMGFLLGSSNFRGRRPLEMAVNTSMAMPTVVVGLILYLLLSRDSSPLATRLANVAARCREFPRFFAEARESLVPERTPHIHAETAVGQNKGIQILESDLQPTAFPVC